MGSDDVDNVDDDDDDDIGERRSYGKSLLHHYVMRANWTSETCRLCSNITLSATEVIQS
jgi:hypothetical protein